MPIPTLLSIDHVQLAMPAGGEERARAFYSGLLGLTEVAKPPKLAARGGAWFETVGVRIHLGIDPDFRPARKAHIAIVADDLDRLAATLGEAGTEVVPDTEIEGVRRFFAHDPFGNRLEFVDGGPQGPAR